MKKRFHVFFFAFLLIGIQSALAADDEQNYESITNRNDQYASWNKGAQKGTPFTPFKLTQAAFFLRCNSKSVNITDPVIDSVTADCGPGFIAISGTSDCDTAPAPGDAVLSSCISTSGTSCAKTFGEFYLTKCSLIVPGTTTITSCALCVPAF